MKYTADIIFKSYREISKILLDSKIHENQYQILKLLMDNNCEVKISELSKQHMVTPAAITTVLDRMEKTYLVIRHRDTKDRRIIFISITQNGKNLYEEAKNIIDRYISKL